ncbi:MAG: glycosyltransferase family 4 protein, partial [Chloroflexi bacterium]|nr:glycosyltransferase family 4 protein [Chloroflexota bacterium]
LGTRVTELAQALAEGGFRTHLFFVGDPHLPGEEHLVDDKLIYHRWCQWLSIYHPNGVYDGEEGKLRDFSQSAPHYIVREIARPAVRSGKVLVVLAEEWHTAEATIALSDLLYWAGFRQNTVIFWNANNVFGFERIHWDRLGFIATITTVSRYMKHLMWRWGVNPVVIPNGIPARLLDPLDQNLVRWLHTLYEGRLSLFKIGRFDPDKRWMMAVEAVARLKERGYPVTFPLRGGMEPHGTTVLSYAHHRGLHVVDVTAGERTMNAAMAALASAPHGDVYNLKFFVPEELARGFYAATDAVLANSGHEPFGLVGLEAMAAGGLVFTGSSGEDYAVPSGNAVVLETDDPEEICAEVVRLRQHPELAAQLREEARRTAARFTWPEVICQLIDKLEYVGRAHGALEGLHEMS